jgi:hypothetical protein
MGIVRRNGSQKESLRIYTLPRPTIRKQTRQFRVRRAIQVKGLSLVAASRQDHGGQAKRRTSRVEAVSWILFWCILRRPARLDLGHAWPTFPNAWGTHVDATRSSAEEAEEGRGKECGECKIQERRRSLGFLAAAFGVVRTIGDVVSRSVALKMSVHTISTKL